MGDDSQAAARESSRWSQKSFASRPSRQSIQKAAQKTQMLERNPSRLFATWFGTIGTSIWNIVTIVDPFTVEPKASSPITFFCGGIVLFLVFGLCFVVAVWHWIKTSPTILVTQGTTSSTLRHPMPDIAITLSENFNEDDGALPLNESLFLKHVTPSFMLRTYEDNHEFGRVKTYKSLKIKYGHEACGMPAMKFQRALYLCVLRDDSYTTTEKLKGMDAEAKKRIGKSTKRATRVEHPFIQGRYNDAYWSFLEIQFSIDATDPVALERDFFKDDNGEKRDMKMNVWLRFDREAWGSSSGKGVERGKWDWFVYQKLTKPLFGATEPGQIGVDYRVECHSNSAYVKPGRPIAGFLHENEKFVWVTHERTTFKDITGLWEAGKKLDWFELSLEMGRNARMLNVTRPDLIDTFNVLGAGYNVAFFWGLTWAGLVTLFVRMLAGRGTSDAGDQDTMEAMRNDAIEACRVEITEETKLGTTQTLQQLTLKLDALEDQNTKLSCKLEKLEEAAVVSNKVSGISTSPSSSQIRPTANSGDAPVGEPVCGEESEPLHL